MVIYDGNFLCVQLTREKNYKVVLDLAKKSDYSEYIPEVNVYCLPPTKRNARTLSEAGYPFDESAKIFLKDRKKKIIKETEAETNIPKNLFPFQKEGVQKMLQMNGNILLADEMGLGKTVQGAVYLSLQKGSLPALVVCPASLKQNWANEIKKWAGVDSYILEGRKSEYYFNEYSDSLIKKYPVFIINYDVLAYEEKAEKDAELKRRKTEKAKAEKEIKDAKTKNNKDIKEVEKKIEQLLFLSDAESLKEVKKLKRTLKVLETEQEKLKRKKVRVEKKDVPLYGWCKELIKIPFQTIVADEVQYISEPDTIRTKAMNLICENLSESKKLFISGTPYETKTSQFFSILHMLKPNIFADRWKFLFRYCDPKKGNFGYSFDGLSHAEELHQIISKFMVRRFKKDVLTQLPPKIRAVVPMHVSSAERSIYDDYDLQFQDDVLTGKKSNKELIGHISHLKQKAYEAKSSAVVAWIKEYLETSDNKKLVVFIYHHSTFDSLMNEFGNKAVGITGETPSEKRQEIVDRFQNDKKIELFIGQIKASGVGLTLTKASATCFVEFGSTAVQHEQAEDRVHRIGQTAESVMAYYLILDNSIENDIMNTLQRRNKDLKKVMNDEDDATLFNTEDMKEEIFFQYKKRKNI